ncbi:MAG: DUF819 family protein [Bacteroidetes bacterium]|nr:MAG: DUF819 family protein [Bacteroidota bacterium]
MDSAMINDPVTVFAVLAGVLAGIFYLSTLPALKKFFERLPPVIWAYFIPMFMTTAGVLPESNSAYSLMSAVLLPMALFLLMISVDVPAIMRLGRVALIMMVTGTVGIVLGGPIAYLIFKGSLPPDAWKGFATLSGSWIGGTANMLFIQNQVAMPDSMLGPVIIVDTVVGYGWMGILLLFANMQERFDKWVGADTSLMDATSARLEAIETKRRPANVADLALLFGFAFFVTIVVSAVAPYVSDFVSSDFLGTSTLGILIIVTLGLALSFTPVRKLEEVGASSMGFVALYLLLTSIGARANLAAVLDAPIFLAAGIVWISIHVGLLFLVAYLIKAPLFFVATGSMANIGGAASAPVVASVYRSSMTSVGLLMAISGYILGIYAALGASWLFEYASGF